MIRRYRTFRTLLAVALSGLLMASTPLQAQTPVTVRENPLLVPSDAPFGAPRFDRIHAADFPEAIAQGLREYEADIDSIRAVAPEAATFENVIDALNRAGRKLRDTQTLLGYLKTVVGGDSLVRIYETTAPALSRASDRTTFDPKIFDLVSALHQKREQLGLDSLALRTLKRYYNGYIARGALRTPDEQQRLSQINEQMTLKRSRHGQNILRATENFVFFVRDSNRLAGLSPSVRQRLARRAWELNRPWEWVITAGDYSGVMANASDRSLREQLYKAFTARCSSGGEYDNRELTAEILNLRLEKARLLGYDTYAEYAIRGNMADTPQGVRELLLPLLRAAGAKAGSEIAQMQALRDEGRDTQLEPWDLYYYLQRLLTERYGNDLRQAGYYLQPDKVRDGMFQVAQRLYGIRMFLRTDIPVCDPQIQVFEARDRDGTTLGLLYLDCFARKGKLKGAATGSLRRYSTDGNSEELPLVTVFCNFARAPRGRVQLMSTSQVKTLFHEFGHALARLFARGPYPQVTGSYPKDMVELPSQLMEHWAWQPEVMKNYTSHYQTGKPMPRDLIDRIRENRTALKGTSLLASYFTMLLDLELHGITEPTTPEGVEALTAELRERYGIPAAIPITDPTVLNHIFDGPYGAQYYAYTWAAVLDTDAFAAFTETGDPFDKAVAERFRRHILTQIGYDKPARQYVRFRGRMPGPEALMERYGLTLSEEHPAKPESAAE